MQEPGASADVIGTPLELASHPGIFGRQRAGRFALLAAGPTLLLLLKLFPSLDQTVFHSPLGHMLIAGGASSLAALLALLVLQVAWHWQDARVFLVGLGFLSAAGIFFFHAIATPDVLMTGRGLATSWSAYVSLVIGGVFFALSGLEIRPLFNRLLMQYAGRWLLIGLVCWLAYGWLFLLWLPSQNASPAPAPQHAGSVAQDLDDQGYGASGMTSHQQQESVSSPIMHIMDVMASTLQPMITIFGLICYGIAIWRYWILYRQTPSQASLALIYGLALLVEALCTMPFWTIYGPSFWLVHIEEFAGFGVISYAILVAYQRGQTRQGLLESLFLSGTRAQLQAEYTGMLDALVSVLAHGEQPPASMRQLLRERFGLAESQIQLLERTAGLIAQERQHRQELERLNADLRQLEYARDQLTQMVIHDLKNPLTALIGFLDMLRNSGLTDDQRDLLNSALRSGRNLAGLISDLLDVGRMQEGRMDLERSLIPMPSFLMDCATELRAWLAQERKIVNLDIAANLPLLSADARLLRRVILNLISNAIKHTPAGTRITLRAYSVLLAKGGAPSTPLLMIEVADNGPGIAPELREQIFEKYGRAPSASSTRQNSTGLGLTFCRLAVEAHHGSITVTSAVEGGALFQVLLPVA